jgi:hypothetical protein
MQIAFGKILDVLEQPRSRLIELCFNVDSVHHAPFGVAIFATHLKLVPFGSGPLAALLARKTDGIRYELFTF